MRVTDLSIPWIASLPKRVRDQAVNALTDEEAVHEDIDLTWFVRTARKAQTPPTGDWRAWLLLAGRGYGKTRAGAEIVRVMAEGGGARRIALIAPTAADARGVMVEGESGLLALSSPDQQPAYEPSKHQLTWPNGAIATT
jgi:phage terminase large subunit-like protein